MNQKAHTQILLNTKMNHKIVRGKSVGTQHRRSVRIHVTCVCSISDLMSGKSVMQNWTTQREQNFFIFILSK